MTTLEVLLVILSVMCTTQCTHGYKFIEGPQDAGGRCGRNSYLFNNHCCCSDGCCWDNCKYNPPKNCLSAVPNAQWVFNRDRKIHQAVQNFRQRGCKAQDTYWPLDCPNLPVPASILKVKVWYDDGFLRSNGIKNHDGAKAYIYATMAIVQNHMCSTTIGTTLDTELVAIEYMPKTFTTGKGQSLEDMKQEIKGDRSGANIHVAFLDDNCGGSSDCGGGMAVTGPICGRDSAALCNIHSSPSLMANCVAHEMGHVLGMSHDWEVGCGYNAGHMSDQPDRWSSCSSRAFSEKYTALLKKKEWCLSPAKSNACQKRQTRVRGYNDVGFGGKCPSPTYPFNDACCGENYCCWEKCSLSNPPDEYLNGLYKGKWMYDTTKGYYHAVSHFEGSEFDCNDRIKPKDCVVEKYLVGQKDAPGGTCPRGTHQFGEHCCCMDGCCWADCSWGYQGSSPPNSCLSAIPNARWVKNPKKNGYIAVRNRP